MTEIKTGIVRSKTMKARRWCERHAKSVNWCCLVVSGAALFVTSALMPSTSGHVSLKRIFSDSHLGFAILTLCASCFFFVVFSVVASPLRTTDEEDDECASGGTGSGRNGRDRVTIDENVVADQILPRGYVDPSDCDDSDATIRVSENRLRKDANEIVCDVDECLVLHCRKLAPVKTGGCGCAKPCKVCKCDSGSRVSQSATEVSQPAKTQTEGRDIFKGLGRLADGRFMIRCVDSFITHLIAIVFPDASILAPACALDGGGICGRGGTCGRGGGVSG